MPNSIDKAMPSTDASIDVMPLALEMDKRTDDVIAAGAKRDEDQQQRRADRRVVVCDGRRGPGDEVPEAGGIEEERIIVRGRRDVLRQRGEESRVRLAGQQC